MYHYMIIYHYVIIYLNVFLILSKIVSSKRNIINAHKTPTITPCTMEPTTAISMIAHSIPAEAIINRY